MHKFLLISRSSSCLYSFLLLLHLCHHSSTTSSLKHLLTSKQSHPPTLSAPTTRYPRRTLVNSNHVSYLALHAYSSHNFSRSLCLRLNVCSRIRTSYVSQSDTAAFQPPDNATFIYRDDLNPNLRDDKPDPRTDGFICTRNAGCVMSAYKAKCHGRLK